MADKTQNWISRGPLGSVTSSFLAYIMSARHNRTAFLWELPICCLYGLGGMLSPNNPNLTPAHSHPSPLTTKKVSAIRIQPKPYSRKLAPRLDAVTLRIGVCFLLLLTSSPTLRIPTNTPAAKKTIPRMEPAPKN